MARRWVWVTAAASAVLVLGSVLLVGPAGYGRLAGSVRYGWLVGSAGYGRPLGTRVRYDFDAGLAGAVYDERRRVPLRASEAAGGTLSTERHGSGLAVRFPQVCPVYGDDSCPRAILESWPMPILNPGTADLRFGAAMLIAADETTKGGNVLQKGYSVGGSQFKLQVDGYAGKPTCVLVGSGDPTIHVVASSVTVANGQWHVVECLRAGETFTIAVDGRITGRHNVPTQLSIVNGDPLRIGGKGTSANNDQFHGALDDAYVAIGA
jgi:hypothetical protein